MYSFPYEFARGSISTSIILSHAEVSTRKTPETTARKVVTNHNKNMPRLDDAHVDGLDAGRVSECSIDVLVVKKVLVFLDKVCTGFNLCKLHEEVKRVLKTQLIKHYKPVQYR